MAENAPSGYHPAMDDAAPKKSRSYGLRRGKRVYEGYNDERKVTGRRKKEKQRLGYQAFAKEFPRTHNPLPAKYQNKIITGDSAVVLGRLPDSCVDIVITSPPYNFGLDYDAHRDTDHWRAYFDKLFLIFEQCVRVVKYGGRIIVNVQPLFSDYIPTHHIISQFFLDKGLIWKGEILWEKNNYNCKYTAWGSWKSPSSPYLKYTWEFLEIFCKGDLKKSGRKEDIDISDDEFKNWVNAKWSIAPERDMQKHGHPAMFPEKLVLRALKLFSFRGDVVLDPFNGAGTTTLTAHNLGRNYIGIDCSAEYCETAKQRISDSGAPPIKMRAPKPSAAFAA